MTTVINKGQIGEQDLYRFDGSGTNTFTRDTSTGATLTLTKIGYEVNALSAYGGGVLFTDATVTAALTAIGTTNKATMYLAPGTWVFNENIDYSAYTNITFKLPPGAVISHGAFTLNIPNIEAGLYKIFTGSGVVTLGGNTEIYPDWFDSTDGDIISLAISAIGASRLATIVLSNTSSTSTTYPITANAIVTSNITLRINRGAIIQVATNKTLTINSGFTAGIHKVFSCVGTGQVKFAVGTVVEVYPQWFGAIADTSTTDNTIPFQKAVASVIWGGHLRIPAGKYKITDEISLHSGMTIEGDSQIDYYFGDSQLDTGYEKTPTYIWQYTEDKAVFFMDSTAHAVKFVAFKNLALASAADPAVSMADYEGKIGIKMTGSYPYGVEVISFEKMSIYNFAYGIYLNDPAAPTDDGTDWMVNPVSLKEIRFIYNEVGIYLNSSNADAWTYENCVFLLPASSKGLHLVRFGFFEMINCYGGAVSVSSNTMIYIKPNGDSATESFKLNNVQAETCTHLLHADSGGTAQTYKKTATLQNCISQMTADVTFEFAWNVVSIGNEYQVSPVITAAGCIVTSIGDRFIGGASFYFSGAAAGERLYNNLPGANDAVYLVSTINGVLYQLNSVAPASGTYKVGDIVWNSEPASAESIGWVCTVAPNTFKAFGTIA